MKIKILLLLCFVFPLSAVLAQSVKIYQLKSPDGKISITVNPGSTIKWSVKHEDTEIITPSVISMTLDNGEVLGKNAVIKKSPAIAINQVINTPIYKKDKVHDNCNQLTLTFKGDY